VERDQLRQVVAHFITSLVVGRTFVLQVSQVDESVQFLGFPLDQVGDFDGPQLDQGRAANSLLHPQLAALHATGKVNFALASQQWYGTHFAQVYANGVVGINRFLDGRCVSEIFAVMHFLRVKKAAFLVKRKSERLMTLAQELVFEMIHVVHPRQTTTPLFSKDLARPNSSVCNSCLGVEAAYSITVFRI